LTPRSLPASEPLAGTGEYSIYGLARAINRSERRERRIGFTLIVFAVATAVAIAYELERYLYSRLNGRPVSFLQLIPAELMFTYAWALLTPFVMATAKRFPVRDRPRAGNLSVLALAMIVFVFVHVAILTAATAAVGADPTPAGSLAAHFGQYLFSWGVLDSLVFCTLVAVHDAVVYSRVSRDRAVRASQLEARLAQAQLQMLRMQLQPHFLFNTLNSISALMHKDVARADSMIVALSDLLRMSLQNIGAQEVALQSEVEFLERYVEIMRMRFGDRLQVTLDIDPAVRDARVPNLFLQPLVENSFRHGFVDLGQGTIQITIRRDGDMLRCDVVDDGRGLRAGYKEGVGLASTRQRLAHLYGDQHSFTVRGAAGAGVHVAMSIPFNPFDRAAAD
jgi:two-component sensor histidine kinase